MKVIFGRKPVLEAINSDAGIEQVYVAFGQKGDVIEKIIIASKKHGIKVSKISPQKFSSLAPGRNTQGVVALISAHKYFSLNEVIVYSQKSKYPLLLLLDSIQDPHNLGAILRTAECSGVDGIILTINNSASITDTVEKTSAGAVSHLKICKEKNLNNAIKKLKEKGFWITGSTLENSKDYTEVDYKVPIALVVGNEEKGIRKLVAENCDFLVKIPMKGEIQSLNVSVATGILLFEVLRQRNSR